jgi:hypothetical protein
MRLSIDMRNEDADYLSTDNSLNVCVVFHPRRYGLLPTVDSEMRMAKKVVKLRVWTKEDIRTLKTLARAKKKTTVIARTLKRSVGATYQQASKLGVTLGSRG